MPSLREIRNRIASIKSIGKITRAMEMVSSAKLRKAQNALAKAKPYSEQLRLMLSYVSSSIEKEQYPLLTVRPKKRTVELIVIGGDKGLCGGFNANVVKHAFKHMEELSTQGINFRLTTIGKRMRDLFKRSFPIRDSLADYSRVLNYADVQRIAQDIIESYSDESIDEALIISNEFKSIAVQVVASHQLLPIEPFTALGEGGPSPLFLFEPDEGEILNRLLPKYVENRIYTAMLESRAAEEAARMLAMQNATTNTEELTDQLTLQYNKARQASITTELIDIVSGAQAISQ